MGQLRTETGRVISISRAATPSSQVALTIETSTGKHKQIVMYQGRQPLMLIEGEEVTCIVKDTGTILQGLAIVNLSRHLHQETPPQSMYFQKQILFFIAYLILVEVVCLLYFNPRHGNMLQMFLFLGVFILALLPITPSLRRWANKFREGRFLMTDARQLLRYVLEAQHWTTATPGPLQFGDKEELSFPQNKKGVYFARIWRPAPGTVVETPRICPFCNDVIAARDIGLQLLDETISVMKKGGITEPPILTIHTCEHHFATLNPRALAGEINKMVLSIFGIGIGDGLLIISAIAVFTGNFIVLCIILIISLVVANGLIVGFGFKRILKGNLEKNEKLHFGSWRWKQVTIYAMNSRWLAEFTQLHPELLAPVREIQR